MALQISHDTPVLVAYDRKRLSVLLRDGTPERLRADLQNGLFGEQLTAAQMEDLDELLLAWEQRALGAMSLRDAMLVDHDRGVLVYNLICVALTSAQVAVPPALATYLTTAPCDLLQLPAALSAEPQLVTLAEQAQRDNLALAWLARADRFPPPPDLEVLLPTPPRSLRDEPPPFELPSGWRRRGAAVLAVCGVAMLVLPLLSGRIPESPARWPLALITTALMLGIKAGPAGYLGAACIWLVANLPGFRHGLSIQQLWPAPLLLSFGLLALSADRRVRLMWRWLRRRLTTRTEE